MGRRKRKACRLTVTRLPASSLRKQKPFQPQPPYRQMSSANRTLLMIIAYTLRSLADQIIEIVGKPSQE